MTNKLKWNILRRIALRLQTEIGYILQPKKLLNERDVRYPQRNITSRHVVRVETNGQSHIAYGRQ